MKKLAFPMILALIFTSCIRVNQPGTPEIHVSEKADKDGIFIHVTKGPDDAHEVLMALSMATKFVDEYDVLMYFDIEGIRMVTKDAPNLKMEPFGSSDDLFEELVNEGVTIFACPGCMKVEGVQASDLRSGVTVADKDEFFDFTEGRILSIDY